MLTPWQTAVGVTRRRIDRHKSCQHDVRHHELRNRHRERVREALHSMKGQGSVLTR